MMGILKIVLWTFVIIVVAYAIYLAYNDISKHIPQEKKKVEKFDEPKLKICLFYANFCGFCTKYLKAGTFMDTYDKIKQQSKFDKVVFVEFDFDKNKELGNRYGVSSFPTILAISSNGDLIAEFKGDRNNPDDLIKFTSDCLNKV
jgi:thiol-disulfide isomerase/thioredoxin